jgi:hypothetical protein
MNVNFNSDNEITNFREVFTELNINIGKIILEQLDAILNGKIKDGYNLQSNIENFFLEEIGLSKKELELLKERLTK